MPKEKSQLWFFSPVIDICIGKFFLQKCLQAENILLNNFQPASKTNPAVEKKKSKF